MPIVVPRTCTIVAEGGRKDSLPLERFRECGAYVLLGEPGAGKTTTFEEEATEVGGMMISARDFAAFGPSPDWRGEPLFIDGLDEMRAGRAEGLAAIDAVRGRLHRLGRPPFRLSCREADWLGATDRDALERVSPDGKIAVLHLDSLSEEQAALLLNENFGIPDPRAFLREATGRRLDALLGNPQTLSMLAEAVLHQGWPGGLTATYERACRSLAEESNKKHRDIRRGQTVATEDIISAAGHVCAVQLLAGIAGFALDRDAADEAHPALDSIGLSITPVLDRALHSRLFEARGHEERREPLHRSIAEYLGAIFLARKIERDGLPVGRVLALMTADDDGIVSDLRGLHAWLAALCPSIRSRLVDHDPLGVVLYGDVGDFGTEGKLRLLESLGREAKRYPRFRSRNWEARPFGALASPDMIEPFRKILIADDRTEGHESFLDCVLETLAQGAPLPELGDPLLEIVRDDSHWPTNRKAAIAAYINVSGGSAVPLLDLLADIQAGHVTDGDDELMGRLLRHLYPQCIDARAIIDYLHPARDQRLVGHYAWFWEHDLLDRTAPRDLPVLLDQVAANQERVFEPVAQLDFGRFAGELLIRGLDAAGATTSVERLWNWLAIGASEGARGRLDKDHEDRVTAWLAGHPDIFKDLLRFSLHRCEREDRPLPCLYATERRLHGAGLPAGTEEWCFELASATQRVEVRNYIFNKGVFVLVQRLDHTPALLEALLAIGGRHPLLASNVDAWLCCPLEDWRYDHAQRDARRAEERQARIEDWRRHLRAHFSAIESGTAYPRIMHELAMIYFGRRFEAEGDTPAQRLRSFFGDDVELMLAALAGLKRTLERADLPPVAEIVDLAVKGRHHYIAEACLAGIEELSREDGQSLLALPDPVVERLVAFRLTHSFDNTPPWFMSLVAHRSHIVAETLVTYGTAMFRAGKENVSGIRALAYDGDYEQVARLAVLPLLAAYPLRAKKASLSDLTTLLHAAIRLFPAKDLEEPIARRSVLSSLDVAQRSQWLAAGLLLFPADHEKLLAKYVGKSKSRALLVAGFFDAHLERVSPLPELSESAAALLVRLLGSHVSPDRPEGIHWVSPEMKATELVRSWIVRLSASPTAGATAALSVLRDLEALRAWHGELEHRRESQRAIRREACFLRGSVAKVVQVLANSAPANAADLKALLAQHLRDMAGEDRDGNTTGYLRYWAVGEPHHENYCRDRLLDLLRERLRPTLVDAQPEGEYRENKRADIRASSGGIGGFNVPIEIKRDSHKDLWRALRDQLMAHYVRDPGADGHGIYLVFWFGGKGMPLPIDGGKKPRSAQELEGRLRAQLTPEERRRIEVIVLDCAPPSSA